MRKPTNPSLASCVLALALQGLWASNSWAQDRVAQAKRSQAADLGRIYRNAGSSYPPSEVYIRAFKAERTLELWARNAGSKRFRLIRAYPIAAMSGGLGPKRMRGDQQAPEGLYRIDRFNPQSAYHLSLGLDYPNASDKVRSGKNDPGNNIFIHGSNVSIGCLAMTDPMIEQIYLSAWSARKNGQKKIRVDVFPFRMDRPRSAWNGNKASLQLWNELVPFYESFEKRRQPSAFRIGTDGAYMPVGL